MIKKIANKVLDLASLNYNLARKIYMHRMERDFNQRRGNPILIYQMGKVGSKTIRLSLQKRVSDSAIYHTHLLTKDRIIETEEKRKQYFRTERYGYLKRPWQNSFIRSAVDRNISPKKWKVITLTRDPLSRNISAFFENCHFEYDKNTDRYRVSSDYYDFDMDISSDEHEKIMDVFIDKLNHKSPLEFMDKEIKAVLGVDVYTSDFPKDKGYAIFEGDQIDVLLIKLEKLKDCSKDAFKEFLALDDFELINTNVGGDKNYANLYKEFRKNIRIPSDYVDSLYDSKYMQHFYTEEEKAKFKSRWNIK